MHFRTTLVTAGKTATGIEVPPGVVEELGAGKKPPVVVTINAGHTYRSTVAARGDRFLVGVSAEHREAAGVAGGDEVDVEITLDTAPREVAVPADLAAALAAVPGARERFDALAYSHRKEHVRAIEEAKAEATRERRVAKTVEKVSGA